MSLIAQLLQEIGEDERRAGEQECFIGHEFTQVDLRQKLARALRRIELRPYFADKELTGGFILHKVCRKILVTRASIIDLTKANPNVYFELGVAIGLNKPVFIVLKKGSYTTPLLENFVKLRFTSYSNLERDLAAQAPRWLEDSLEHHLRFNNHCHFVDTLCPDRHRIEPKRRIFIIDQITLGADVFDEAHYAGDQDFQNEVLAALSTFHFTPLTLGDLAIADQYRLCDYCRSVRNSDVAVCHLSAESTIEVYLLLGLAVGLGIPVALILRQNLGLTEAKALPSILRGLDTFEYHHYSEISDRLVEMVEGLLNRLKRTLATDKKLPYGDALYVRRVAIDYRIEDDPTPQNSEQVAQEVELTVPYDEQVVNSYKSSMQLPTQARNSLWIDESNKEAWVEGNRVELTPQDFDLLFYLYQRPGQLCSRQAIIRTVFGVEYEKEEWFKFEHNRLSSAVSRLRQKLEPYIDTSRYLITVRGRGYKLIL